ncbi:MAG: hypothetical protein K5917_00230, partial [Clostridiales bacterium]|nr:hypothetical protein [Clostridiales bacterium]
AALWWTTCEVGLGEAVDTMAPVVAVTSPAASTVLAGPIALKGTCGDDKGVRTINIVVINVGTGTKYNYTGKLDDLTNWSLTINEMVEGAGYPLPDGSYTADVTAVDIYGRVSGTSSTAFDIDNTAPLFCVTSPDSIVIANPRKYGRSVTVSGEIADDHDIEKMTIRVFKTDSNGANVQEITGNFAKTEFKDFETAGGTTVYVAKYFDSVPAAQNSDGSDNLDLLLYKNYLAIFGIDPNTTSLTNAQEETLKNNAYVYIVPTLIDKAGNKSQASYVSTKLKNLAARLCGVETTIDSLQTAQLMKIYNGTYTGEELNDEQKGKIISLLNGSYVMQSGDEPYYSRYVDGDGAQQSPLTASVNSNNRPKYSFSGYELDLSSLQWNEVNTGGTISVSVQSGLDGWGVKPNTIKVKIDRCDDNATIYTDAAIKKQFVSGQSEGFTLTNALGESIADISTSVSAQSYYVTLPRLSSGERYILSAEGLDEDGNSLGPVADKYGFMVASTGVAPRIDCSDRYYIKGTNVLTATELYAGNKIRLSIVDGTDTINDGDANHYVKVTRKLYSDHIPSKGYLGNYTTNNVETDTFTGSQIAKDSTNEYHLDVPLNKYATLAEGNYTIALNVEAKNSAATTESSYILWVDNKKPVITITAPTANDTIFDNNASISKDDSGNFYYTPYGKWSDINGAGTSALWYTITDTGNAAPTISGNATDGWTIVGNSDGNNGNFSWTKIDSAVQADAETGWEKKYGVTESTGNFIKMIAVDKVGNISDVAKIEGFAFDFNVPAISLASEPSGSNPVAVKEYYNSYITADSDNNLAWTFAASDTLALHSSESIIVTAKKLNKSTGVYDTILSGNSGYTCESPVLTDSNKNSTLKIKLKADGSSDGTWTFSAKSKDVYGRTSAETSFSTIVDRTLPALVAYDANKAIAIKGTGSVADWFKDETLSVSGKFTEAASGSGLSKIYYWLLTPTMQKNQATAPYVIPSDLTNEASVTGDYYGNVVVAQNANTGSEVVYTIAPNGFEEIITETPAGGTPVTYYNELYIQTIDKAGNKSARIGPYQIKEDKGEPSLEAKYYTYGNSTFSQAAGTAVSNGSNNMILYGKVKDPLSGVSNISFAIGSNAIAPTITYTTANIAESASGSDFADCTYNAASDITDKTEITGFKAVIASGVLASGSLYAKASDLAGNASANQKFFDLAIDKTSPTITLTTPVTKLAASVYVNDGTAGSGGDNVAVANVNGEMTISGTASDAGDNLQSVEVFVSTNDSADVLGSDTRLVSLSDTSMYNWSVSNSFSYIENGKFKFSGGSLFSGSAKDIYIKVKAVDAAANKRINVYKYSVNPNSDRPVIKLFKPLNGMTSEDANYKWVTNDTSISGSVTDDDGIDFISATYSLYNATSGAWSDPASLTVSNSNGSFSVNGLSDGKQIITFTVKDKAGTTFVAHAGGTAGSENDSYIAPIITGNDTTPTQYGLASTGDSLIYVKVDNSIPIMRDVKYSIYDSGAATPAYGDFTDTLATLGGKRTKLKMQFYVFDENGIDSVTFSMTDGTNAQNINGTVADTTTEADGYFLCTISDIKINDTIQLASGTWPATITVTDKAGLKSSSTYNITVDNTAPVITKIGPDGNQSVSGSQTVYGSVDGASLSYGVSANTTTAPSEYKALESSLSWYIYFDGDTSATNHDKVLKDYLIDLGITTQADIDNNSYTTVTSLYIWLKAVDAVGNESLEKFEIKVDPQGDKPTVEINNPSANGSTVGDKVRVYGSASDNEEPKAVFVQIISNKHDTSIKASGTYGSFAYSGDTFSSYNLTADDLNYLAAVKDASNAPVYKIYKMATYNPTSDSNATWPSTGGTDEEAKNYGVLATLNGRSWFLNINSRGEFDDDTQTNSVALRVYAIDAVATRGTGDQAVTKANLSQPAYRQMTFDANVPIISDVNVRKYTGTVSSSANYASTTNYVEDMFVKGETWLSFTLSDPSAIGSLAIGLSSTTADAARSASQTITLPEDASDKTTGDVICKSVSTGDDLNKTVKVLAKLNTSSGVGTKYIYIHFADKTGASSTENYVIKYDNTAPVLAGVTDSEYGINPSVVQSNGWYNFKSKVTEADSGANKQSGFERVAFYFVRRDTTATGTPTYIYDPMIKKAATGNKITVGDTLTYSEGLYWTSQTVTRTSSPDTLTLTSADSHIHVGGLVKIKGTVYRISSLSGTTLGIEGQPEGASGETETAYFAIGNVVDHTITESANGSDLTLSGYGYGYKAPTGDDGDLMVEGVRQDGTDWTWQASIYSKNIPDGPIELHYVAFDKAGNYTKGIMGNVDSDTYKDYGTPDAIEYKTDNSSVSVYAYAQTAGSTIYQGGDVAAFVSNNAPRLTNLYAGTDLNGNNSVSADEMTAQVYTTSLSGWENAKDSLTLGRAAEGTTPAQAAFTAKGLTVIKPEIIGGNGALYYSYTITGADYTITGQNDTELFASNANRENQTSAEAASINLQVGDFINLAHTTGSGNGIPDCATSSPTKLDFT